MGIMETADSLLKALQDAGIEFGLGQTAVVCNDGVMFIAVSEEDEYVDINICNRKIEFDYDLNITKADIEEFNTELESLLIEE